MRKIMMIAGAIYLLAGCAYPVQRTEQGAAAGLLFFPGAGTDARVLIDGADAGAASQYDGTKQYLSVAPGTHQIAVSSGGRVVLDKKYYVGSGSRVAVQ
jgi:hypothetical protein